ncbi:TraB/GumN family protein [Flavobacterium hibisci]|uniref:TraB/GumN family protein n=1 Tax=Flavobacterium hibisci TaxID=1914462 RepID=UPI001CC02934|nr:TraB/GumN family protein [Flavobacterium hibisci]MBZ4043314.1 TraB/GumN family protein [Flavobacterium hibisci]
MKNLIKSTIAVILFIFSGTIQAQKKAPKLENSLLWEVSGNGLSKPSYLYGTIHMICSSDYFLSDKTKKAFEASEKLVLEIDMSDPKEMTDLQQMAMGKEPLSKTLSPENLSKLDNVLKSNGMTVQQLDNFKLFTIMSLISMKSFGCNDLKFYEMNFIETAKQRKLPIIGLETVNSQMEAFAKSYTDTEMIDALKESSTLETAKLVSQYKQENITAIYDAFTTNKSMSKKTKEIILDNRNENWIKQLPDLMEKESLFIAVGSAHLAGESGVINLLKKAGYIVKPVMK